MHRFFVPDQGWEGDQIFLSGGEARQIDKVLRLRPGAVIEVLDGSGCAFLARLEVVSSSRVQGRILGRKEVWTESPLQLTLGQALPRGSKMDFIVQKATELGVSRIVPLWGERTIGEGIGEQRLSRWQRIAKESAEQCGRLLIPTVESPRSLISFLAEEREGRGLLFWEGERDLFLRQVLAEGRRDTHYVLLVGAEGGFSPQEVDMAKGRGFLSVSLGGRILRCETVALVILALLQYARGDLG